MRGLTVWLEEGAAEAVRRDAASAGISVSALLRQRLMLAYPIPYRLPWESQTWSSGGTTAIDWNFRVYA